MTAAVSVALGLFLLTVAAGKLTGHPGSLAIRDHLKVPASRWRQIGLLEAAGATILLALALATATVALQAANAS